MGDRYLSPTNHFSLQGYASIKEGTTCSDRYPGNLDFSCTNPNR
jgi:hypothetical protein